MKIKMPKDLNTLSKDQLVELVHELVAKMDNLTVEAEREKELKPTCKAKTACKPKSSCCKSR